MIRLTTTDQLHSDYRRHRTGEVRQEAMPIIAPADYIPLSLSPIFAMSLQPAKAAQVGASVRDFQG